MDNLNSVKYVSLKTAAGLYGYSRDHLGLMIRQDKLKGVKLGSYYVTTNEWMIDYVKNFADPNHSTFKNKLSNKFLTETLSLKKNAPPVVNMKDFIKKPLRSVVFKNAQNNIVEEREQYVGNSDLENKILKELSQYKSLISGRNFQSDIDQIKNENAVLTTSFSNAPYVILPIRKMENAEREEILKKIE